MKYYTAPTSVIESGPGDKPLSILLGRKKITEEAFTKMIDDFFSDCIASAEKVAETKALCWQYLNAGKDVTIGDQTLRIIK